MDAAEAGAESARRKLKRAAGLIRDATADLAAVSGGQAALGVTRVHDVRSRADVLALIDLGVGRHGAVDVVVVARPTGRARQHPPTTAPAGAKENDTHGTQAPR